MYRSRVDTDQTPLLGRHFRTAAQEYRAAIVGALKPHNWTLQTYLVLDLLTSCGDVPLADVARLVDRSRFDLEWHLDDLVKIGLLEPRSGTIDETQVPVRPSARGVHEFTVVSRSMIDVEQRFSIGLTATDLEELTAIFEGMSQVPREGADLSFSLTRSFTRAALEVRASMTASLKKAKSSRTRFALLEMIATGLKPRKTDVARLLNRTWAAISTELQEMQSRRLIEEMFPPSSRSGRAWESEVIHGGGETASLLVPPSGSLIDGPFVPPITPVDLSESTGAKMTKKLLSAGRSEYRAGAEAVALVENQNFSRLPADQRQRADSYFGAIVYCLRQ